MAARNNWGSWWDSLNGGKLTKAHRRQGRPDNSSTPTTPKEESTQTNQNYSLHTYNMPVSRKPLYYK